MRSVLTLLILTLNLLNILRANEDISKKTKVLACIALSKARIAQDSV